MKTTLNLKKCKKATAFALAITFVASSGYYAYAASTREAWNNAASSQTTGTVLSDGSTVYPNVYANSEAWAEWKTSWETIRSNYEQIALTPGKDATELNFAWYSHTMETPAIRLTDKDGNPSGDTFYGTQGTTPLNVTENSVTTALYPNKVTVNELSENTTYYYQYFLNGGWSDTYTYQTQDTEDFSVLYVGDPQIGASTGQTATEENTFTNTKEYYARNDAYNWNETLKNAVTLNPNLSFILSAGDQINQTGVSSDKDNLQQQVEYSGFLYSSVLRSLPIAAAIGNHDNSSPNYQNHFNNPNSYSEEVGASVAGNDYYFSYGNALFVIINTNNYNCQTHKDLIEEALASNPDATWKVLMFHQDIYGSGADHSDSDGMILRTQLTTIIDEAGFDIVLQGHDHTYSRTYQLGSDGNVYNAYDKTVDTSSEEFVTANASCYNILTNTDSVNKVINPGGTVYFEANSSTGSKFYQLIATQQDYIAARSQSWRPTYSVVDIDEVSLTVRTYDAATNEELVADGGIETSYTIVKCVDKTNLESMIAEATAKLGDTSGYTTESVTNLRAVLEAAQTIFDNPEAGSVDVASAYTSIDDAIKALKTVNTSSNTNTTNATTTTSASKEASKETSSTPIVTVTPQTGDNTDQSVSLSLAVLSGGGMLVLLYLNLTKKRQKECSK